MNKKYPRRKILAGAGLLGLGAVAFNPVQELLRAISRGRIKESLSKHMNNRLEAYPARNYLAFHLYGAPSRWFFDHILRPTDQHGFVPSAGVCNLFSKIDPANPHLIEGAYADVMMNGINMPHLWQYDVPRPGGQTRPMADLMRNMLMIRGCDMQIEGHPVNSSRLVAPTVGDFSITGMVADMSRALIPAVSMGVTPANRAYKSKNGTCNVEIPSDHHDYINYLLDSFSGEKTETMASKALAEGDMNEALGVLEAYASSNLPGAEVLYHERHRSAELMKKGLDGLQDIFPTLVKKYEDLFTRALNLTPIKGVTDLPVPGAKFPFSLEGELSYREALAPHHFSDKFMVHDDLRTTFLKAQTQNLPQQFALAEFLLTEGLSSSILLASPGERGFTFHQLPVQFLGPEHVSRRYDPKTKRTYFDLIAGSKKEDHDAILPHDSHETGWILNTLCCNLFYRGFSAALLELIDRLKEVPVGNGSVFDETIIHYATEFDRSPMERGAGLSHNPNGQVSSFFSGAIDGTHLLGNIYVGTNPKNLDRRIYNRTAMGTMGEAAPVEALHGKTVDPNNVSSSLSTLLRLPPLVPRAQSLIEEKGDKYQSAIEPARNIEDV